MEKPLSSSQPISIDYQAPSTPRIRPRIGRAIRYGFYALIFGVIACLYLVFFVLAIIHRSEVGTAYWIALPILLLFAAFFAMIALWTFRSMKAAFRGEDRPL